MSVQQQFSDYADLIRWDKPIGTLLLLWPTLTALWIANQGRPAGSLLVIFISGTVLMRSAGCIMNDMTDRRFDGCVNRTHQRPLVTGKVTIAQAAILLVSLLLLAANLLWFLNSLTRYLAVVALVLAAAYPFLKRFTHWPQLFLGLAFSWGIPLAFAASVNQVPVIAWWLFAINMIWTLVYDTLYAMVDREDDMKIGIKSTAILFARADRVILAGLQSLLIVALIVLGDTLHFSYGFYVGIFGVAACFLYQQYLIRSREPQQCFKAFLNHHWALFSFFLGVCVSYS